MFFIYKYWDNKESLKRFNVNKYIYIYSINEIKKIKKEELIDFEELVNDYLGNKSIYNNFTKKFNIKILKNNINLLDMRSSNNALNIKLLEKKDYILNDINFFKYNINNDDCMIQNIGNEIILKKLDNLEFKKRSKNIGSKYYSVKCIRLYAPGNKTITKITYFKKEKNSSYSTLWNDICHYPYFEKIKRNLIQLDFIDEYQSNLDNNSSKELLINLRNRLNKLKDYYNN